MNPCLRSASPSKRIASLLTLFLAAAWTSSFVAVLHLHQLKRQDHHYIQLQTWSVRSKNRNVAPEQRQGSTAGKDVHIVFSTDCSGYQHWQSLASYYSFRRAGHLGPITRIVSGCDPDEVAAIRAEFHKIQTKSDQLRLHFTPSFSIGGKKYKYSNKPGGLYHWIRNRTATTLREPVIALVDPDMLPLRPVVAQLGEGTTTTSVARDLVEYRDGHDRATMLRRKHLPPLPSHVTRGAAAGQHFGLGGFWASAGTNKARPDFQEFNASKVCGAESPCANAELTTRELTDRNYAVGPVYIASTSDWIDLLPRWHAFTPRVHAQYPKLLAEMFAFTMAAADRQLKFALSSSYMVSDPNTMSTTEAWLWIDEYAKRGGSATTNRVNTVNVMRSVCEGATSSSLPTKTLRRLEHYGHGSYYHGGDSVPFAGDGDSVPFAGDESGGGLPTVLHFCQSYKLANHTFAKRKMRHDFFRCAGEPLKLDVEALVTALDSIEGDDRLSETQKKKEMRTAFMICHLIPLMNLALIDYKLDVCAT